MNDGTAADMLSFLCCELNIMSSKLNTVSYELNSAVIDNQYITSCRLIWAILRANISHFTAQYHPYCTPIWPILQRGLYVTANQLLRNPFSKVLPQSHSPLLWRGRGRLPLFAFPPFGRVRVGTLCSFSLPLGGSG